MDPEAATELARKGATLLLDVPQRTLFGIDTQVGGIRPPTIASRSELFGACVKQCDGFSPLPASRSSADVLCWAQVQRDEDGAPGCPFRLLLLPKQVSVSANYKSRFLQHFNYQLFGNNVDDLC